VHIRLIKITIKDTKDGFQETLTGCVQDNGEPVPLASALRERGIWAKRPEASSLAEAQVIAQKYKGLLKNDPKKPLYQ